MSESAKPPNPQKSNPESELVQRVLAEAAGEDLVSVPLNKFQPGKFPNISLFSTTTVYGKRKSGKSVFIKWYLQFYKYELPWFWIFTLTRVNSFYESWIPEKFIIPNFSAEALEQIMARQTLARRMAERDPRINPRACVIWDDYNGRDIRYNDTLASYYYTGRHFMTFNVFAAQHITLTPPAIRSNTDLVILFNTDYADSLEHYWRDFAGKLPKETFYRLFAQATSEKNHFLAINNDPKVPLSEKFFEGCAELLDEGPDWIVGCREMWLENEEQLEKIHGGHYNRIFEFAQHLSEHDPELTPLSSVDEQDGEGFEMPDPPVLNDLNYSKQKLVKSDKDPLPFPKELQDSAPRKSQPAVSFRI